MTWMSQNSKRMDKCDANNNNNSISLNDRYFFPRYLHKNYLNECNELDEEFSNSNSVVIKNERFGRIKEEEEEEEEEGVADDRRSRYLVDSKGYEVVYLENQQHQDGGRLLVDATTQTYERKLIPYQWWKTSLANQLHLKCRGHRFLASLVDLHKSTVFKLKLRREYVMVCDDVGIKCLLTNENVKRESVFGRRMLNARILKGHVPCAFTNDEQHRGKKTFIKGYLRNATKHLTINDLFVPILLEFEKMASINFSFPCNASNFDYERTIKTAVTNVMTFYFLGEYLDCADLIHKWQKHAFKFRMEHSCRPNRDEELTDELYSKIESTKKIRELRYKAEAMGMNYGEMVSEIVWGVCFTAVRNTTTAVISCLLCYLRLPEIDKRSINEDSSRFFSTDITNLETILPSLKNLHTFYFEVLRLHPPTREIIARAKHDFVLESRSGSFQIKHDHVLLGYYHYAHRDSRIFENPHALMLNRPIELLERNTFAYGGEFYDELNASSHKCPVKSISHNIVKIFIMLFTKCHIVPTKNFTYSGRRYKRLKASDEPLRVLKFSFKK